MGDAPAVAQSNGKAPNGDVGADNFVHQAPGTYRRSKSSSSLRRVRSEHLQDGKENLAGVPRKIASLSSQLEFFVKERGGDFPIHSVLVANNGIAAVKFIRSVRMWAYHSFGNERAVTLVAMATPEDMKIDAEHIRLADQFVEVPGGSNANNYANVRLIVATAQRAMVDAVWPGWGHASEKPELPAALAPLGIRFLGPPATAMAVLGDKIGSTILAQSAGVPTIPWSGSHVTIDYAACSNGEISPDVYDKACIHSVEEALECCQQVGYPVMLKASWGGGGKGIRKVFNDDEVRAVFRQVQGEVPGSPIFAMRLAPQSRHLEVQLLADMYGNVVSLYSRDCSTQRRHQKIVEEGPVTAASPEVLAHMEACARALVRSVSYVGAATVEYLYQVQDGKYCFLELNPRLQVEHPVTEWISGVNIPAAQLMLGMGVPLHCVPDIRRMFGRDIAGNDEINFEAIGERLPPQGHVMAVRVTAENADDGFKPTAGTIDEISFRSTPEVWGYFSVKSGGGIHEYSDSQFGHLFAKGETREAAIRAMVVALKEVRVRGEIRTITDYVRGLLEDKDFVGNKIHTGWLDARIAAQVGSGRPPWHLAVIAGALLRALGHCSARSAEFLGYLEKGQLPPPRISLTHFEEEMVVEGVKYRVQAVRRGEQSFRLALGGSYVDVVVRRLSDGGMLMQVDGESHVVHTEEEALGTRLAIGSSTVLLSNDTDPSRLVAISPGKLVRYLVEPGQAVRMDEPYAEIEVMKMMMPLLAPAAGLIEFQAPEGAVLAPGDLIARLDLEDPAAVLQSVPFEGSFPELGPPLVLEDALETQYGRAKEAAACVMAGYEHPVDAVVDDLLCCIDDPALPLAQWTEVWEVVQTKLPADLAARLQAAVGEYEVGAGGGGGGTPTVAGGSESCGERFCAADVSAIMRKAIESAPPKDKAALQSLLEPLLEVATAHAGGMQGFAQHVAGGLLESYLQVEEKFQRRGGLTEQEVIDSLRQVYSLRLQHVLDLVVSHQGLATKTTLVLRLLSSLVLPQPDAYRPQLRRLAALTGPGYTQVALRAQQLLERSMLGELRSVVARALSGLDMFADTQFARLVNAPNPAALDDEQQSSPSPSTAAADSGGGSSPADSPAQGAAAHHRHQQHGGGSVAVGAGVAVEKSGRRSSIELPLSPLSPGGAAADGIQARMAMLVEAPAGGVEDALASLLDHHDPVLRSRALETYLRRVYSPFLLRQPRMPPARAVGPQACVWMHQDPSADCTDQLREAVSTAVVLERLDQLPDALRAAADARDAQGLAATPAATLHVVLGGAGAGGGPGQDGPLLQLTPEAQAILEAEGTPSPGPAGGRFSADVEDAMAGGGAALDIKEVEAALQAQVGACSNAIRAAGYSTVSVLTLCQLLAPTRTGLRWHEQDGAFVKSPLLSEVEPPMAQLLELRKLEGLGRQPTYVPTRRRQWHTYAVLERPPRSSFPTLKRAFLRGVVRQLGKPALLAATYSGDADACATAAFEEVEESMAAALAELERVAVEVPGSRDGPTSPDWSHVFLTLLPPLPLHRPKDSARVAAALRAAAAALVSRHGPALRRAAVAQWEVRLRVPDRSGAWRVVVSSPTGHESGEECVEVYREQVLTSAPPTPPPLQQQQPGSSSSAGMVDADGLATAGVVVYSKQRQAFDQLGLLHGKPILHSYPPLEPLQQRRLAARRHRTTYCRDFPAVFENALRDVWATRLAAGHPNSAPPAGRLVEVQELVPQGPLLLHGTVRLETRPDPQRQTGAGSEAEVVGQQRVGVVVWLLTLRTPECPQGRQVVSIANDITFNSGAFGPAEDAVFRAATDWALAERLPLLYLAANSGAKVGLSNEVKQCLQVEWVDPSDPGRGFQYLYLKDDDYADLAARADLQQQALATASGGGAGAAGGGGAASAGPLLRGERRVMSDGEVRHVLSDIIGLEDGLGVECLSGSGAIASAYSKAFDEGLTITLVSGRTVGIGAYLARLGRRCVQRVDQPIILTGYAALNKLLGRPVYTSHMQLGGPKVMGFNGVSHHVVADDLEGVARLLTWLSYMPLHVGGTPPALPGADPAERPVAYLPPAGQKPDPRAAIAGCYAGVGGPSAQEDGTPLGANSGVGGGDTGAGDQWQSGLFDRDSWVECQAGWARTVITGHARLGGLPVGVIAVETQTVMLNVPADPGMPDTSERSIPQAGQVWFPDSALKTAHAIEEFDREGLPLFVLANWRGFSGGQRDLFEGVLQAGSMIVESLRKYRRPVFVYLMPGAELRGGAWVVVDSQINATQIEMYADPGARGGVLEPEGIVEIKFRKPDLLAAMHRLDPTIRDLKAAGGPGSEAAIRAREAELVPVYTQIATQFAEMHDTPVRMMAKRVLRGVVPWASARAFFYNRLKRRLTQGGMVAHIRSADGSIGPGQATSLVRRWYLAATVPTRQQQRRGTAEAAAAAAPGLKLAPEPFDDGEEQQVVAGQQQQQGGGGGNAHAAREDEPALWADDRAFLSWADSPAGAARIAMELKALRAESAADLIRDAASTSEGRDGLLKGLSQAIHFDPALKLQLQGLLQ